MSIITGLQQAFTFPFEFAADLDKGVAYTLNSSGKAIAATAGGITLGFTLEDRKTGQIGACTVPGPVVQDTAGGTIAVMNYVRSDATTPATKVTAITPVAGGATVTYVRGIAISAASANAPVQYVQVIGITVTT